MKILFVSKNLIAADVCRRLLREGNEVKLFIQAEPLKKAFDGIVPKSNNWKKDLEWVTTEGLIIFDDIGFGKDQDYLRSQGYFVVGGCEKSDLLEQDREYAQEEFKKRGFTTKEIHTFSNAFHASEFVKKNKKRWVIKQNDANFKELTYIGEHAQGSDVVNVLEQYQNHDLYKNTSISIHEYVEGIEIGVGRYFNGDQWVGPIEINCEHKKLCNENIGPITGEMGTLAWFTNNEGELFKKILTPWEDFLRNAHFHGDFEINCIITNTKEIIPIEITPRLGSPITFLQEHLITSSLTDFFYSVATGRDIKISFKPHYGIIQLVAIPPFPYSFKNSHKLEYLIFFDNLSKKEMERIHFDEVFYENKTYKTIDESGHIFYVTGSGSSISDIQKNNKLIIEKIILPKKIYRTDIGTLFIEKQKKELLKMGFLSKKDLPKNNKKFWFI